MRTDLSIRLGDGTVQDVAVLGPDGTTLADVAAPLAAVVPQARILFVGSRRLPADTVVGRGLLAAGSVVSGQRSGDDAASWAGRLEVVAGSGAGRGVTPTARATVAGRARSCELRIVDPLASRRHAEFRRTGAGVSVRDLGSTHGTFVDGVRIARTPVLLQPGSLVRIGSSRLALADDTAGPAAAVYDTSGGGALVTRAPSPAGTPKGRVIVLPEPPAGHRAPRVPWPAALVPAVGAAGLAWMTDSWPFLAFTAITPIALLSGVFGEKVHWRRARRRAVASHRQAREWADRELSAALRAEVRHRRAVDPDPAVVARIARTPTVRLWHRRPAAGRLAARVGLGISPSHTRVERAGRVESAANLPDVPVRVDLAAGPVGIALPRPECRALARWIVAQLATFVPPAELELVVLVDDLHAWHWLRWLPHLRATAATTSAAQHELIDELAETVRRRSRQTPDRSSAARSWTGRSLVILVEAGAPAAGRLGAVLRDGPAVGVTALCLAGHATELPDGCTQFVRPGGDSGGRIEVDRADRITLTTAATDQVDLDWADRVARALTPLHATCGDQSTPSRCRLTDLFAMPRPTAAAVRARWARSNGAPDTVIGIGRDGPLIVDLDRDGPHVLVAGTTGSGKSELLQALVAGLAVGHPPSELTFLLVDYKGGAAFSACARLPHTVGLITDLDEHLTHRVLVSLAGEIRRREALFAGAGARDLGEYRRHARDGEPLPRLVLVVDEFAALADELAGFVPGLLDIAQRGRSLGLHLVLATQRPSGTVSAEIRANTALRICLRVTGAAESIDVVETPEAALIEPGVPGRGVIRTGTETVEFQGGQVAVPARAQRSDPVRVVPLGAWRRLDEPAEPTSETDLFLIVDAAREAAAGQPAPRRPWCPSLPERLTLAELGVGPSAAEEVPAGPAVVPIGLLDLPEQQRQQPLTLDLAAGGSLLVAGRPRSGRSAALHTVALAAASRLPPSELHLYGVDASGRGLTGLAELPHCGTVATLADGFDLVARLVTRLEDEIAARRHGPPDARPMLVLLVDGWEQLVGAAEDCDAGRTVERLLAVMRDVPRGVTVVAAGGRALLSPRMAAHASLRIVLAVHDSDDYLLAGVDPAAAPSTPAAGRGVRAGDGAELQLAIPVGTAVCTARAVAPGSADRRIRIRPLPGRVRLADVTRGLSAPTRGVVIGVGGDDASPLRLDLSSSGSRLLVAGPARSGRSTALCVVLAQLSHCPVLVAASRRSPVAALAAERGLPVVGPHDPPPALSENAVLVADDVEQFTDTAVGAALVAWLRADGGRRPAVGAGSADQLAVSFRGVGAELRQAGCGVLLQPGAVDGELFGISLPRGRTTTQPGRGVLVPDPAWGLGDDVLPLQVAQL